jgi:hypothetical protein
MDEAEYTGSAAQIEQIDIGNTNQSITAKLHEGNIVYEVKTNPFLVYDGSSYTFYYALCTYNFIFFSGDQIINTQSISVEVEIKEGVNTIYVVPNFPSNSYPNFVDVSVSIFGISSNTVRINIIASDNPVDPIDGIPDPLPWVNAHGFPVLGVRFKNIIIPEELKSKILGYKIYRAERNSSNSIVLDEARLFPVYMNKTIADNKAEGISFSSGIINGPNKAVISNAFSSHPQSILYNKESFNSIQYINKFKVDGAKKIRELATPIKHKARIPKNVAEVKLPFRLSSPAVSGYAGITDLTTVNNELEEPKILLVTNKNVAPNDVAPPPELYELGSIKRNLYFPHTSQKLISSGYVFDSNTQNTGDMFFGDMYYSREDLTVRDVSRRVKNNQHESNPNTGALLYNSLLGKYSQYMYLGKVNLNEIGSITLSNALNSSNVISARDTSSLDDEYDNYNKAYLLRADFKPSFPTINDNLKRRVFNNRVIRNYRETNLNNITRVFKSEDYIDIRSDRGEILKITPISDSLLIHSTRGFFLTKGTEKVLVDSATNISSVYLGTGNILAAQPSELYPTDIGYGGMVSPDHSKYSEYGYYFVDYDKRQIIKITDKPESISDVLMNRKFKEIIPFTLERYGFKYDPEQHNYWFNFNFGMDYYRKLVYISKKERVLRDGFTFLENLPNGYVRISNGADNYITNYSNDSVFYTDGWTISYSPVENKWISFHSFVPEKYIPSVSEFLTLHNNKIYIHGYGQTCNYYGIQYPFTVKIIDNKDSIVDKQISALAFSTRVLSQNNNNLQETFDTVRVYNSYQDTGDIDLSNLENTRQVRGVWYLNQLRVTGSANNKYPDWYLKRKLKDKYHIIELNKNNLADKSVQLFSCEAIGSLPHR